MFRAGDKANAGHLEQVAQAGGTSNAYTTNYVTSYYNAVPPEKFEEILKKEAARIGVLTNDTAAAAIELDVVKRERTQRGDSTAAKAYEKAMAALWRDNPNGRPVIGLPVDLDGLTLDDAKAFHAKWYGVSNVGLVISGKTTVDEAYDLVTRYFASLPKSAVPDRPWMRANMPQSKLDRMEVFGPDIGTPSLTRMRVVALADATKPAVLAQVMIAAQALSGSADSRLQRPLVYGEPVALNVNLGAATEFNNSMVVSLSASPLDRKNLDGLDRRLDAELAAIRAKPLTDAEVEKVKRRYIAAFSQSTDRPGAAAAAFSNAFAEGQSPADVEAWPETVKAVSTAQVNAMVQNLIAPGAWLHMRLLPKAVMPPPSHPKGPKVAKAKGGDK
jgi:zinc protease